MELFQYQKNLFIGIAAFLILIVIYLQLLLRREKITLAIFDEKILSNILPQNVKNLRRTKDILFLIAVLFALLSSSGPQWGIEYKEKPAYLANVAIVVDTSLSMSAKDLKPSRLDNVKLSIKSLIENLNGYRISLMAFQDKAYLQCPLTDDIDAVSYFIDILTPNMLPYPGTNIADAIETASEYLNYYKGDNTVILFTDGEDHSGKIDEAIKKAKDLKIKFITVGIGTAQGELVYDEETKSYKKDKYGKTVITKLDESTLIKIAQQTQGKYIKYTNPEFVASEIKKSLNKTQNLKNSNKTETYHNRFQYFLIVAFILFLIEFIIMEEQTGNALKLGSFIFLFFFSVGPIFSQNIKSEFTAEKGNNFYKKQEYIKAKEYYEKAEKENPENDKIKFNLANSLYKNENYDKAIEKYSEIKNPRILSKALYNIGNSYYMKQDIKNAEEYYKKAILSDPTNSDAKFNLELLLKKKQASSKNQSKDNKKNENNNDNKDKNENQNNEQNEKQKKEEEKKEQQKKEKQKQAEQFLDMIKNQEKQNLKQLQSKPNNQGAIKNEFDW